jgi:hypothetical protein
MATRMPAPMRVFRVPRTAAVGPTTMRPTGPSANAPRASQEATREILSLGMFSCMVVTHSTS